MKTVPVDGRMKQMRNRRMADRSGITSLTVTVTVAVSLLDYDDL